MRRSIRIIIAMVLALGAVEATAYWWMHPAPNGPDQPVLVYRPGEVRTEPLNEEAAANEPAQSASSGPSSTIHDQQSATSSSSPSTLNPQQSTSLTTSLPELYDKAAPMLRCSTGQVSHVQLDETLGLHLAFFEWNDTDTGSVLEAFRHMPEACMGSIGMTLVSKEMPIHYQVGDQSLVFDHTIFREPAQGGGFAAYGPQVHAFRGIWVAGMADSDARQGIGGDEFDNLRAIRLKSALTRFRPSHARVIQGAVRGAANGEAAWTAFVETMLKDLKFQ